MTTDTTDTQRNRRRRIDTVVSELNKLSFDHPAAVASFAWLHGGEDIDPYELRLARREFALVHHPDLARTDDDRSLATRRMATANAAIDQAIAEAR